MAFVNAGIKEIFWAPGGATFPVTSAGINGLGIRHDGKMTVEPFNPLTDNHNRQFPNMVNFKIEADTMQISLPRIADLITRAKAGSAAVGLIASGAGIATGQITSANGGVFLFDGANNCLGVDFELSITQAERALKVIFERAFKYTNPDAIIDVADTNQIASAVGAVPSLDTASVLTGFLSPLSGMTNFIPAAETALTGAFADMYLDEYNINIKTKNTKSAFNLSMVTGLDVEVSATAIGADIASMVQAMKQMFPANDLVLTISTGKTITFAKEGLSRMGNLEIGDTKRSVTVKYTGSYDLDFVKATGAAGSETDIKLNSVLV